MTSTLIARKVLILSGDGLNCEQETAAACRALGVPAEIRHLNDLIDEKWDQPRLESTFGAVIIPGGFSFGDEWGSGRVLALKIRDHLKWDLRAFARNGGWVLGICNGFQALIRLGVFGKSVSITHNTSGQFINRWISMRSLQSEAWLSGMNHFEFPMRHGEGKILVSGDLPDDVRNAVQYEEDVNGSWERSAALSAEEGRLLGIMPHPEAAFYGYHVPGWTLCPENAYQPGPGQALFLNLKNHLVQSPSIGVSRIEFHAKE